MPPHATRTIFVANIPYDVSEEQLAGVFSEVGPVSNVEIKFDPQTGRSKGYAFVQFYDDATASSAVRNLANVEVNGRNLRVEASTDEPGPRQRDGGGSGGGMPGAGMGGGGGPGRGGPQGGRGGAGGRGGRDDTPPNRYGGAGPGPGPGYPPQMGGPGPGPGGMGYGGPPGSGPGPLPLGGGVGDQQPRVDLSLLPPGQDIPPNMGKATDAISKTLAAVSPGQMQDVMAGMKTLVMTQPDQARQLLQSKPQLAYALFQAMLLMNIVDASVLQRIQPIPATQNQSYGGPPVLPQAAQPLSQPGYQNYNQPPPTAQTYSHPPPPQQNAYRPPGPPGPGPGPGPGPAGGGYGYSRGPPGPAPQPQPQATGLAALPPQAQAALAGLPEDQKAMLVQVLQLTPDQISALDPTQRASITQLRQQFLGTA